MLQDIKTYRALIDKKPFAVNLNKLRITQTMHGRNHFLKFFLASKPNSGIRFLLLGVVVPAFAGFLAVLPARNALDELR